MQGLAVLAAALGVFLAALAGCWLSLFWALRWAAFAASGRRSASLRWQRGLLAALAAMAGLACAATGFLGIAALMLYIPAP